MTGDYEVGYCKPPRHTRFPKGRSGNPSGRPSGRRNLATLLGDALDTPVFVSENGRRRRIPKRDLVIAQLVNQAAKADLRATKILLAVMQDIERRAPPPAPPAAFTPADEEPIAELVERIRNSTGRSGS